MSAITVVVATMNRREGLQRTLEHLAALPGTPVIVVDNGSSDGTPEMVHRVFPHVELVRLPGNAGAAARTAGAQRAVTPFVAFCDDDTWWEPGSLERASAILENHPRIAVLNARVLVGDDGRLDPASAMMRDAGADDFPIGKPIQFFMAGACVARRDAFLMCGGYDPRFHIGAEETVLSIDLASRGWLLRYVDDLVVHHYPQTARGNGRKRRSAVLRNRLWSAWLRHQSSSAWRTTRELLVRVPADPAARMAFVQALGGLPWVLRERRPVSSRLQERIDAVWSIDA